MAEVQFNFFETPEETIQNFEVIAADDSKLDIFERTAIAINILKHGLLNQNWVFCASVSGGKDSMTTLSISLAAMAMAVKELPLTKTQPVFYLVCSDTLMENLLKADYLDVQFERAVEYGKRNGFDVKVFRPSPDRTTSFLRIFSGAKPDPTPALNSAKKECASDYKIDPIHKAMRQINKETTNNGQKLVMLVGSRSEESTRRAESLKETKASYIEPVFIDGYWTLYPIMDWSLDDIWNYITWSEDDLNARLPGYQNGLTDVAELYSSLNGGECVAGLQQTEKACGARDGCHQCGIVTNDKSGTNQANSKELYHLKKTLSGLLAMRDYRIGHGKNFQNRNFVTMVNSEGSIELKPNGYAGWLLEENLRIILTLQVLERKRANDLSVAVSRIEQKLADQTIHNPRRAKQWLRKVSNHTKPLLNMISESDVVWIDYQWSLRGLTRRPHSAIRIWDEIVNKGQLVDIPTNKTSRPDFVSEKPFRNVFIKPTSGKIIHNILFDESTDELNDPMMDFYETGHGISQRSVKLNAKGDMHYSELFNVDEKYDVDEESANFICNNPDIVLDKFKAPSSNRSNFVDGKWVTESYMLSQNTVDKLNYNTRHQQCIKSLLQLGVIKVNKNQLKSISTKLKILEFTARSGLQELAYVGGQALPTDFPIIFDQEDSYSGDLFAISL